MSFPKIKQLVSGEPRVKEKEKTWLFVSAAAQSLGSSRAMLG